MNLLKTSKKRKRSEQINAELPGDIVLDILLRLPVRSLGRFQCACKAWRAMIADQSFISAHLERTASRWEQDPSLVIVPLTLDRRIKPREDAWPWPSKFSGHIRFYRWQQSSNNNAQELLHAEELGGEFLCRLAHCDGLVLVPTDARLFLINPATKDAIELPESGRNQREPCHCAGLGLDPRTGKYKVARAFYRYVNTVRNTYKETAMEVYTVNGGGLHHVWRETELNAPYPISKYQTAVAVNGCLFWRVDEDFRRTKYPSLRVIVRFRLSDESFGPLLLPDSLDPALRDSFTMDTLHGELWLSAPTTTSSVTVWSTPVQEDLGDGQMDVGRWVRRCSVPIAADCHPMALLSAGTRLFLWSRSHLYSYDPATTELTTEGDMDCMRYHGRRARTWKNLWNFSVLPYTESLLRITA